MLLTPVGLYWMMGYTLANTTEPSVCSGDAALCQITLTSCFLCAKVTNLGFRVSVMVRVKGSCRCSSQQRIVTSGSMC